MNAITTAKLSTAEMHARACRAAVAKHLDDCDACAPCATFDQPRPADCRVLDSLLDELLIASSLIADIKTNLSTNFQKGETRD